MANQWLRLWHDMPNDPKWRTIARVSGQPISAVLAVYVHLLVIASNATERGRTQNVCSEDLASALDLDTEQIDSILAAMQGRVLDGDMVSGWAKRQVEREDGSAERAKRWREAQKNAKQTQPNATEREQTPDKDTDTDTDTEEIKPLSALQAKTDPPTRLNGKTAMVEQVMAYLNLQARRNYRVKNPDGSPTAGALVIAKRLKEGYTVDQCKDVIGEKSNQWMGSAEMDRYLNPQTLFRKSNFDRYLAEADAAQC